MYYPQVNFYDMFQNTFFNTSNGPDIITVSILFRRLKNTVLYPPGIGNTSTLTSSRRTQIRNTPLTTEARVVRQTHSGVFTGGPQTDCYHCHHPPVSSLRPRICLVGRTMAPSQLQAAPTHRRRRLDRRLYLAKGTTLHPQCTIPNSVYSATTSLWRWRCASSANSEA